MRHRWESKKPKNIGRKRKHPKTQTEKEKRRNDGQNKGGKTGGKRKRVELEAERKIGHEKNAYCLNRKTGWWRQ